MSEHNQRNKINVINTLATFLVAYISKIRTSYIIDISKITEKYSNILQCTASKWT